MVVMLREKLKMPGKTHGDKEIDRYTGKGYAQIG